MIPSAIRGILRLIRGPEPRCRVLFVCMGNICRSPTAEAVFRHRLEQLGLAQDVYCASAGTHDIHRGGAPDGRARAVALRRGYDMSRLRARHLADADFERFDLIVAMDQQNMAALVQRCPPAQQAKLRLLMQFAKQHTVLEVPDP